MSQSHFPFYEEYPPSRSGRSAAGLKVRESVGAVCDIPVHDRPRERLERLGTDSLTDAELLAVLLGFGGRSRSPLDVAHDLLECWGGIEQIARQTVAEIARVSGIGRVRATVIKAAFALQERLCRPSADRSPLDHPGKVYELMRGRFALLSVEVLYGLALDSKLRLIRVYPVSSGLVNQTLVHAREAFREAITSAGVAHLVLAHNHPSGDANPSADDVRITRQMQRAGQALGIPLIDHVIVGRPSPTNPLGYVSLKQSGIVDFNLG
ncbi:MAG: DNA repair protein RadC [Verrucomicrobiae bacterium]|nr:DNA repair protein RadC [Verrucomicrobiae bacterium]